jgi:hypothetical protein
MKQQQAKKPGLFKQMLPLAGTVAGSFFGPLGSMAGGALGSAIAGGGLNQSSNHYLG